MSALAALLLVGACSSGKGSSGDASPSRSTSPSPSPSPSSAVSVPAGVKLTPPGSRLAYGDRAAVAYEATKDTGTVLDLQVDGARKGSLADFKDFILDNSYKRTANYYYVDVTVQNAGTTDVGGVAVPLWGVDGKNVLLPAVDFTTRFPPCPSKHLPDTFQPGDTFSTCLVYLSPDHGSLAAVSYRPEQSFNPILWTGPLTAASVKPSPTAKSTHPSGG